MSPLVVLIGIAAAPVVVLSILRVNAAIIFLSLCLGSVLEQFAGNDAHSFTNLLSTKPSISSYGISLALLLLPAVFTTLVMIATVRGSLGLILNILPAISVGLLAVLLVVPLMSPGLHGAIVSTNIWQYVQRAQVLVITVGSILSLLFLWMQRPKHAHREKHGKH